MELHLPKWVKDFFHYFEPRCKCGNDNCTCSQVDLQLNKEPKSKGIIKKESETRREKGNYGEKCLFCGSTDIYSGSWTPETCRECGAFYWMDTWFKE